VIFQCRVLSCTDEGPRLVFIRVPDAKAEKNRLHYWTLPIARVR